MFKFMITAPHHHPQHLCVRTSLVEKLRDIWLGSW